MLSRLRFVPSLTCQCKRARSRYFRIVTYMGESALTDGMRRRTTFAARRIAKAEFKSKSQDNV